MDDDLSCAATAKPPPIPITLVTQHVAKAKKRRTRKGCRTCKRRKVKCDEIKPTCGQCTRFSLSCIPSGPHPDTRNQEYGRENSPSLSSSPLILRPSYSILGDEVQEPLVRVFVEDVSRDMFRSVTPGCTEAYVNAILPLIHSSPTVLHAVQAVAGLYAASAVTKPSEPVSSTSNALRKTRIDGLEHQLRAIKLLAEDLKDPDRAQSDATLVTTILLCLCEETLDADIMHAVRHLVGARQLIRTRFFENDSNINVRHEITWSTRLMIKLFIWHDMMTVLTLPQSSYSASWNFDVLRLTDMLNQSGDVNPLLFGCARDVFWLMSDVAQFAHEIQAAPRKTSDASWQLQFLPKALKIEKRLQNYDPFRAPMRLYTGSHILTDQDFRDCLVVVDLFRRTALLYLYQILPAMLPDFLVDELAQDILSVIFSTPKTSKSLSFHGWILVTAGSQCQNSEDRQRVIEQLEFIQSRFRTGSIARNASRFMTEVWRKRDEARDRGECLGDWQFHWTGIMQDLGWRLMLV